MNIEMAWIRQARRVLTADAQLFQARPAKYWLDFTLSLTLAYSSATIFLLWPPGSWPQLVAYPFAVFWLYRLGSLVHEVAHLPHYEMRLFKVVWNLAVGVMTLAPSPFFTRHHRDHHSQAVYGTSEDPEYIVNVFRPGSLLSIATYTLLVALFPLLVFCRFLLTPLTYLHPALRQWTLIHASALTMNCAMCATRLGKTTAVDRRRVALLFASGCYAGGGGFRSVALVAPATHVCIGTGRVNAESVAAVGRSSLCKPWN